MELRDKGYTLYKKGLKNTEIAERLGVPVNTVKSWARRYWKTENAGAKRTRKPAPAAPDAPPRKRGAPIGNLNGVGNNGGAPVGNQNALKHGGYAEVMFGSFAVEHRKAMAESEAPTAEELLQQEIDLLTLRERYLLDRMQACEQKEIHIKQVTTGKEQVNFKRADGDSEKEAEDQCRYSEMVDEAVNQNERLPGTTMYVTTTAESAYIRLERLERVLTQVQRQKAKVIAQLTALRQEQQHNERDIEDLASIRKAVFGDDDIDIDPDV